MKWFRFYSESRHDPKVQRLPAELFRAWVNLLCLANENNGSIPIDNLGYELRMSDAKAAKCVDELKKAGLLDQGETLQPHNWNARQYKSDDVATRVRRYRERQRNVTETPPDTDTDTDTDTEKKDINSAPSAPTKDFPDGKTKRGSRLAADWEPSPEDRSFAEQLGLSADTEAAEFRDYWLAVPGSKGCKLDWSATWRNRCRDVAARRQRGIPGGGRMAHRQSPNSLIAAARAVAAQIEGEP